MNDALKKELDDEIASAKEAKEAMNEWFESHINVCSALRVAVEALNEIACWHQGPEAERWFDNKARTTLTELSRILGVEGAE